MRAGKVAQIEIVSEQEQPSGWIFEIRILDEHGSRQHCRLTLSWADYNLWSPDGADEPQRVAAAVLAYLTSHLSAKEIRPSFDASLVRRMFDDADESIPGHIRRNM